MRKPEVKLPPEDPAVVAAREREQRRAENARAEETQALLIGATQRRLRRTGRLGAVGGVPLIRPTGGGVSGGGTGGGSVMSGGGGSGGGRMLVDTPGALSRFETALY